MPQFLAKEFYYRFDGSFKFKFFIQIVIRKLVLKKQCGKKFARTKLTSRKSLATETRTIIIISVYQGDKLESTFDLLYFWTKVKRRVDP